MISYPFIRPQAEKLAKKCTILHNRIQPTLTCTRASTDFIAATSLVVRRVLAYMHDHLGESFGLKDVLFLPHVKPRI